MKENERRAQHRYLNDPYFHTLVNNLEKFMMEVAIDPNEIHDAVNLAADNVRIYKSENYLYDWRGKNDKR